MGRFIKEWGEDGKNDRMKSASSICVSHSYLFVADTFNNQICKLDNNLNVKMKIGKLGFRGGEFKFPFGVTCGAGGKLYVSDLGNDRIQELDENGKFIKTINYKKRVGLATRLVIGRKNEKIILSPTNCTVQVFDVDGKLVCQFGKCGKGIGEFDNPLGLDADKYGNIYVADTGNHRILKFDSNGNFKCSFGKYGKKTGEFNNPCGICIVDNLIYVADEKNNRIQVLEIT